MPGEGKPSPGLTYMGLLTDAPIHTLPRLNTNHGSTAMVHLRFFGPDSATQWYVVEGQEECGEFVFWGLTFGPYDRHWSYFTLRELQATRGPLGYSVCWDESFVPSPYIELVDLAGDKRPMGINSALNAVIAMLEDRPALFKELLRAPGSDVRNLTAVELRLRAAVKKYAATQIRTGLTQSLHVVPPIADDDSGEQTQSFYAGVRATEEVFERLVVSLDEANN